VLALFVDEDPGPRFALELCDAVRARGGVTVTHATADGTRPALALAEINATDEDAPLGIGQECDIDTCSQTYALRRAPMTVGLKFSQDF